MIEHFCLSGLPQVNFCVCNLTECVIVGLNSLSSKENDISSTVDAASKSSRATEKPRVASSSLVFFYSINIFIVCQLQTVYSY